VTSRGIPIRELGIAVAYATLGIWGLIEAKYLIGWSSLAFSVGWLSFAAKGWLAATRERQRTGSRS